MENEDLFYMNIAREISTASVAKIKKVGAILVKDRNIISFGFNGTPVGFDNVCEIDGKLTKLEVLHAETNAIAKCAQSTLSSKDSILYVTLSPCFDCAKLIIQSGIIKVLYIEEYRDPSGLELLNKANILVKKILL